METTKKITLPSDMVVSAINGAADFAAIYAAANKGKENSKRIFVDLPEVIDARESTYIAMLEEDDGTFTVDLIKFLETVKKAAQAEVIRRFSGDTYIDADTICRVLDIQTGGDDE